MRYLIFALMIVTSTVIYDQTDSVRTIVLNSVYVTENKPTFTSTSRQVIPMTNTEMKERGSQTLSDALSTLPGVSQLTTGAISKPVIRGLYGERIQVNVAGLKMEDQQWEDEYGLGLSDVGVGRVELIKGPASLLFGSNAMGGVVNIVEEDWTEQEKNNHNLNFKLFTNTYGAGIDYGFRKSGKNTFMMRTGIESHADYSDGAGNRVPNTRFALYNLKLGYIINRSNFKSENRILAAFNEFGFIADTSEIHEEDEDPRLSRKFENAHQKVLSALFSSINTLKLNETTEWKTTVGLQYNLRQEQERSNTIDLNLALGTVSLNTNLKKQLGTRWTWTNGLAGIFQLNTNYGSRIIVPDATIGEGSVFSYVKFRHLSGKINGNFEAGLRFDHRQIVTHQTGSFNTPTSEIPPFSKGFNDVNGSVGESLTYKNLLLKIDLSSGFRSGNLAELSANGLHEGTPNWYIGNPDMKVEQCLDADISASWQHKWLTLRGSVFSNTFRNYIYLLPTDEEYFGFNIYRYEQTNATLQGFEAGLSIDNKNQFSLSLDYSYLDARRSNGTWLPLTPANRLLFESKYYLPAIVSNWQNVFLSFGVNYTMEQNNTDSFEFPTPDYFILNAGAGVSFKSVRILLTCRNLTDQLYFDHLSRLKYYGLNDMGRNIVLNVGWQF
jgi:iron complex outermembrane recepter protein